MIGRVGNSGIVHSDCSGNRVHCGFIRTVRTQKPGDCINIRLTAVISHGLKTQFTRVSHFCDHDRKFEEILAPGATRASVFGYATYQATIREILYNRRNKMVPALNVASIVEIRQRVGRERAREFVARQIPVSAGDECLLFLWFQPHGWEILNWELVFRKSRVIPTAAESLGRSGSTEFVTNEWLGKSIPYARIDDVVMPDWNSLVSEIRRLGTQPAAP